MIQQDRLHDAGCPAWFAETMGASTTSKVPLTDTASFAMTNAKGHQLQRILKRDENPLS
jgi:hypothetical protein